MKLNLDTDELDSKELGDIINKLQGELALKKKSEKQRRVMTAGQRLERMRKMDATKYPNMVRIYGETTSVLVPFIMADSGYKLVKAIDFRKALRKKMSTAWVGGYVEGQQATFWENVHSEDGKVLICGRDAFKDEGEEDYNHPRFAV